MREVGIQELALSQKAVNMPRSCTSSKNNTVPSDILAETKMKYQIGSAVDWHGFRHFRRKWVELGSVSITTAGEIQWEASTYAGLTVLQILWIY
jgi:hypothetical protein